MSLPRSARRQSRHLRASNLLAVLSTVAATLAVAQDANILYPVEHIEERLRETPLLVLEMEQARPLIDGDRSSRVLLGSTSSGEPLAAKWKPVHRGAQGFNNEPRYELAAYRLQKLFLDENEYVVPPVVLRSKALDEYRAMRPVDGPTLRETSSVLFLLAYWVENVTNREPFREELLSTDASYARHWGNLNILTYLIRHRDGNVGNILLSEVADARRVFAVDNDVAFGSEVSGRGEPWSRLHVRRLPESAIERLRAVTIEDLEAAVGVVAEFAIVDGHLVPVEPSANFDARRGVRISREQVQFGLTSREIADVHRRIRSLLRRVDRGRMETF